MHKIKRTIQTYIIMMLMTLGTLYAAPLMSLAQPAIEPSPLDAVENAGEGNVSFLISERNNVVVDGINRFKVTVTLGKVDLKNADIAGVKVLDARNSNADVTNKFDVDYLNAPDYIVRIQQKASEDLPGDMRYLVVIPITVRVNTPVTNPGNGFLVNMSSEGDAIADGDSSDYTFTRSAIVATNDIGTTLIGNVGGLSLADVTSNDTLNGTAVTLGTDTTITNVTNTTPLVVNTITGQVTVPAGTQTGIYTETYTLCEMTDNTNCDDATVTVTVTEAEIIANDDTNASVSSEGGIVIPEVTLNDTLSGVAFTLGTDVNITNVTDNTPYLTINPIRGEATVPADTPAGTYVETYTICENLNPANCTTADVNVTVLASEIIANDDTSTPILGITGGIAITDITDNDTLGAVLVNLGGDVNITNVTNTTPLVVNTTTGQVSVLAATPSGTYTETYTLCEKLNPTNCDTATITVEVVANPDYKPTLTVYGGIVYGEGVHEFSFDTLVRNLIPNTPHNVSNPLQIRIPRNTAISLNFDVTMTTFKGETVNNSLWSFDDSDSFDYIITYIGSDTPIDRLRFAFTGTFSVEEGEVGKFILETTIKANTGGDSNIDNNSDRDTLQKRL
ncbi:MAG: Unknown protein [uncultured Sulfurovum sp.]|uniref:Uncharacterized protein n=1 Tax=uncultured Sulfurovum sp. TaxID=269237 RepID=A0A6S6TLS6_9BACT|nr:MAG: Unknown protein [uncultured Sulfurovum sp.]